VNHDAGDVSARGIPMPPMAAQAAILQDRFNAADRDKTDNNFDLVAKLSHALNSSTTVVIEAGHKTRSPSYQERYLWLPLEATNGLADGNVYVGDINLDPEKAYEVGLGLDWYGSRAYLEPRVFYRYVDDYIQGTPATDDAVTVIWPDALQFSNVDAKLYGADAAWGVTLTDRLSLDGVVSYVRGKRDDISDELYRIAPLNGRVALTWRQNRWWAALEGIAYAEQDRVSDTNDEKQTDGYQLLNLRGGVEVARDLFLNAGVENIFDSTARDHLAGINRVADSDVGLFRRLPSPGRNFFATLQYRYD
jgi:iron complex outermembrane receptor protein